MQVQVQVRVQWLWQHQCCPLASGAGSQALRRFQERRLRRSRARSVPSLLRVAVLQQAAAAALACSEPPRVLVSQPQQQAQQQQVQGQAWSEGW